MTNANKHFKAVSKSDPSDVVEFDLGDVNIWARDLSLVVSDGGKLKSLDDVLNKKKFTLYYNHEGKWFEMGENDEQ